MALDSLGTNRTAWATAQFTQAYMVGNIVSNAWNQLGQDFKERNSLRETPHNIGVSGQDRIIADERTNSLLIYDTRENARILKDLISKLDISQAEILI